MRSTARPIMRSALLRGAPSAFGAAAAFRPRMLSGTAGSRTLLGLLVERSPQITPDLHDWERTEDERKERLEALHKVSPAALTMSEESPDQERARKRMEQLVEREGSREGEGDRTGDLTSLDRRLAQRLYLLVRTGDEWQLPQHSCTRNIYVGVSALSTETCDGWAAALRRSQRRSVSIVRSFGSVRSVIDTCSTKFQT